MSPRTGIDWGAWLKGERALDPYLIWADATGFAACGSPGVDEAVPMLIEVRAGAWGEMGLAGPLAGLQLPTAQLRDAAKGAQGDTAFFCARVPFDAIGRVVEAAAAIPRFQLALARSAQLSPEDDGRPERPPAPLPPGAPATAAADGAQTVIAVVDDGCPFAHPNLADEAGCTRVRHLWDQGAGSGAARAPWQGLPEFGGGLEIDGVDLARYVSANRARDVYPALGIDRLSGRAVIHGNGICHLAAGRQVPTDLNGRRIARDAASAMPLLFVQLPLATVADSTGGSIGYHVLAALHYIHARTLNPAADTDAKSHPRVVVNVSYGSEAGPHDGTSLPERALADFLVRHERVSLVVAAGNSNRRTMHLAFDLKSGATQQLDWMIGPDHALESYLEIWWPEQAVLDDVEVRIFGPGVAAPGVVAGLGTCAFDEAANPRCGVVFCRRVAQGVNGTLALVAVRATKGVHAASPGPWAVQVVNRGARAIRGVHAWVERNNVVLGRRRRQQAYLMLPRPDEPRVGRRDMELASLANINFAPQVQQAYTVRYLVVGATALFDGDPSRWSSTGPARGGGRLGTDGLAPGELGPARQGLHVDGPFEGTSARCSGSSAAVAVVTRKLAGDFELSRLQTPPYGPAQGGQVKGAGDAVYAASPTPPPAAPPGPQPIHVSIREPDGDGWFSVTPA